MKTTLVAAAAMVVFLNTLLPTSGYSQSISRRFQITPYVNLKGYSWKEFDADGSEALKESGMLISLGAIPRLAFAEDSRLYVDADFQFSFGSVGYEGFIQDNLGNRTPFNTDVGYTAFELTLSSGYDIPASRSWNITPFEGFGFEYWSRDIGQGKVRQGYVEKYSLFMMNLGLRNTILLDRNIQLSSTFLFRFPFGVSESVDLSSTGIGPSDISLNPGINPQIIIRAGGSFYNVFAELYFIAWTLSRSAEDRGFHQPESTRKNFGLRMGYTFAI